MASGNNSKFYFNAEDLMALINSGATHIMVTATPGDTDETTSASVEAFDDSGMSKGASRGCPWPCKGLIEEVTPESLNTAKKALTNTSY